jgi:BioD-like phosphotransacetylase family protein
VKSLIIASTREGAGKTSMLAGLAGAMDRRLGYVKPLGDRFLYRKKRLWDYDAALFSRILGLTGEPETMSIGFDHSKLRFMYDRESMFVELRRVLEMQGADREGMFIECGKDLSYGASVYLDPLTISQETGFPVLIVAGGSEDDIADDLAFIERFVGADEATLAGVIVNKVIHVDDFRQVHLPEIEGLGVRVFGIVPYVKDLTTMTVSMVAERLFARVVAGEDGLARTVRMVAVGAMSVAAAMTDEIIKAPDKLVITSGDRSDMILAAIDAGGTSAIVLTNNILPPSNVASRASEKGIPLLLVPGDTYAVAMQVEKIQPLLTADEAEKREALTRLVSENVDVKSIDALFED